MNIVSFFSGAGGMDIGFENAGFKILWANEYDKDIWQTYSANHPTITLDKRSIFDIPSCDVPDSDGIIGGPPCQSWSAAGKNMGTDDVRGQVFYEYIRIINDKIPKFFVVENVEGITRKTHQKSFQKILDELRTCGTGYQLYHKVLTASDYEVPQDRKRLFIVGIRKDINATFTFPKASNVKVVLRDAIYDLMGNEIPTTTSVTSDSNCYLDAGWSSNFMSRNRVRLWDEFAFTVPASSRHVTMHPQAPKMIQTSKDTFVFS